MAGSSWRSTKARLVLRALLAKGWTVVRERGSHRFLKNVEGETYVFAFHDKDEIGPKMLARIGKGTGLTPEDL